MFIKLTAISGEIIWVNADKIMWIVPYRTKEHTNASIVDMGNECYTRVRESPDMIVKIIKGIG